ncbi:MAG: hypothetical protein AAFY76_04450 [Cyanobacteria bacterium J06649_11]
MKSDLKELLIRTEELEDITQCNVLYFDEAELIRTLFRVPAKARAKLVAFLILALSTFTIVITSYFIIPIIWAVFSIFKVSRIFKFGTLNIYKEVKKHNKLIKHLHVLDQLSDAGNPVKVSDRHIVIEALKSTKENLIRALKTKMILGKHANFRLEELNENSISLEHEKAMINANEYAQLLNDTLGIRISVQKEMKKLKSEFL